MMMNSIWINDTKVFSFSSCSELVSYAAREKKSLIAINAEKILHATEEMRCLINQNIGYADGIGAVWALRRKGLKNTVKIPGCELWLDIVREFSHSRTFYLVGATEGVLQKVIGRLRLQFPGIRIVGARNGYIKDNQEREALLANIEETKPDIVFVAMGSPKQELLMQDMQRRHPAIYQGLGGSFDVYTGNVKRAPDWWVRNNLEWMYRLIMQPTRIRRQIHLIRFFWLLVTDRV